MADNFYKEYFFNNVEEWEINCIEFPSKEIAMEVAKEFKERNKDKNWIWFVVVSNETDFFTVDYFDPEEESDETSFEEWFADCYGENTKRIELF